MFRDPRLRLSFPLPKRISFQKKRDDKVKNFEANIVTLKFHNGLSIKGMVCSHIDRMGSGVIEIWSRVCKKRYTLSVPQLLPGDSATVKVLPNPYASVRENEYNKWDILVESVSRNANERRRGISSVRNCPYYLPDKNGCKGCSLNHVTTDGQIELKLSLLRNLLRKLLSLGTVEDNQFFDNTSNRFVFESKTKNGILLKNILRVNETIEEANIISTNKMSLNQLNVKAPFCVASNSLIAGKSKWLHTSSIVGYRTSADFCVVSSNNKIFISCVRSVFDFHRTDHSVETCIMMNRVSQVLHFLIHRILQGNHFSLEKTCISSFDQPLAFPVFNPLSGLGNISGYGIRSNYDGNKVILILYMHNILIESCDFYHIDEEICHTIKLVSDYISSFMGLSFMGLVVRNIGYSNLIRTKSYLGIGKQCPSSSRDIVIGSYGSFVNEFSLYSKVNTIEEYRKIQVKCYASTYIVPNAFIGIRILEYMTELLSSCELKKSMDTDFKVMDLLASRTSGFFTIGIPSDRRILVVDRQVIPKKQEIPYRILNIKEMESLIMEVESVNSMSGIRELLKFIYKGGNINTTTTPNSIGSITQNVIMNTKVRDGSNDNQNTSSLLSSIDSIEKKKTECNLSLNSSLLIVLVALINNGGRKTKPIRYFLRESLPHRIILISDRLEVVEVETTFLLSLGYNLISSRAFDVDPENIECITITDLVIMA